RIWALGAGPRHAPLQETVGGGRGRVRRAVLSALGDPGGRPAGRPPLPAPDPPLAAAAGGTGALHRPVDRPRYTVRTLAVRPPSWPFGGRGPTDRKRPLDAADVALPVLHRDDQLAPWQFGDRSGQPEFPDAGGSGPELRRQVLPRRRPVRRE